MNCTTCSMLREFHNVRRQSCLHIKLRDVSEIWYTQWKYNRLEELGLIEWEELNEACLNKYIPHEKKEVKVEEFINLKQGNMSVEEYSLTF